MIYYLSPKGDEPIGGILVLARHVDLLGDRATFVAEEPFDLWWAVPKPTLRQITTIDKLTVKPEDTVVVPECRWRWLTDYPAERRILFIQNMAYFEEAGNATEIMVCSLFLHTIMKSKCQLPIHLVYPFWYDEPWCGISKTRPYKLIFVDRRGCRESIDYLIGELKDEIAPQEYFVVNGLTQTELAEKLRQSQVYVHLTYPEGFPAPIIEAWLCGAGVVGYAGGGGLEFMLDGHNACIVPDGDLERVLDDVRNVLRYGNWADLAHEGKRTAWRYNEGMALKQLKGVFS